MSFVVPVLSQQKGTAGIIADLVYELEYRRADVSSNAVSFSDL
jgi:hypothetical protein